MLTMREYYPAEFLKALARSPNQASLQLALNFCTGRQE